MQLLQDIFIIENLQVMNEGKSSGPMKVKGIFGRCNEKNNNGRIYPTPVLEGQLKKVQPMISERRLCGELDHPQNDTVKLSNASHLITKLEMKGDELIGEAEILNTPAGLTAKALVEGGVKIGISSRGMGTLSEDSNGNKIVNEDFRLVTFDLVADPSTRGAFPGLSESTESRFVEQSQNKLKKESNFLVMLESRLRNEYSNVLEEGKKKKKKKGFPDLTGDGKVTKADVLKGRGVIESVEEVDVEDAIVESVLQGYRSIAGALAEGLGLVDEATASRTAKLRSRKSGERDARDHNRAVTRRAFVPGERGTTDISRDGVHAQDAVGPRKRPSRHFVKRKRMAEDQEVEEQRGYAGKGHDGEIYRRTKSGEEEPKKRYIVKKHKHLRVQKQDKFDKPDAYLDSGEEDAGVRAEVNMNKQNAKTSRKDPFHGIKASWGGKRPRIPNSNDRRRNRRRNR